MTALFSDRNIATDTRNQPLRNSLGSVPKELWRVCTGAIIWSTNGLRASKGTAIVETPGYKPTRECTQEKWLGHHGDVLGVRQMYGGVFDPVDHSPMSTQGTTSKFAHIHHDYDGQV